MDLRPNRGGFLRPFGCGWFIREFLWGHGPEGAPAIDPDVGAPQADIFHYYKQALFRRYAEDWALDEALAEIKDREKILRRTLSGKEEAEIFKKVEERYLGRIPYKLTSCRFHSFVVYFSNLQRLGWVEFTGREEPSLFQDHYSPGPPRKYFRLTQAGKEAGDAAWSNPLLTLYSERWGGEEEAHRYVASLRKNTSISESNYSEVIQAQPADKDGQNPHKLGIIAVNNRRNPITQPQVRDLPGVFLFMC